MNGIEWLRTLRTKQLLVLKNRSYESFLRWGETGWRDDKYGEVVFSYQDLKQVLSERSHIPNGWETKHIRKTAAKKKMRIYQSSK